MVERFGEAGIQELAGYLGELLEAGHAPWIDDPVRCTTLLRRMIGG